jgi:choline dehydrogenase
MTMMTGKALGGTSTIHSNVYHRSTAGEWNGFAQNGMKGWSWEDVEPFFNKSERTLTHSDVSHRGVKGLLPSFRILHLANGCHDLGPLKNQRISTTYSSFTSQFVTVRFPNIAPSDITCSVQAACPDLGISFINAANDPSAPSVSCTRTDLTVDESGRRCSAFSAFLPPDVARERKDRLHICPETVVKSLLFEDQDSDLRATGVCIEEEDEKKAKRPITVGARKEVVLCAGAIGTPQLLMLR